MDSENKDLPEQHFQVDYFEWELENEQITHSKENEKQYKNAFIPNEHNRPPYREPVGYLNGVPCVKYQNIMLISADINSGKSSVCEAILAKVLNKDCDGLGFSFSNDIKRAVLFDFERRNDDIYTGWLKVKKRAEREIVDDVLIVGMMMVKTLNERLEMIKQIIIDFKPNLVLIDGAGDLVKSVNDDQDAERAVEFLREIANDFNLTVITTIHPNHGQIKPRGHIGSELLRECSVSAIIKKDRGIHTLTTDWLHGKTRHSGIAETSFRFDDQLEMMVSTDPIEKLKEDISVLSKDNINSILQSLFREKSELNKKETQDKLRWILKQPMFNERGGLIRIRTSNQDIDWSIAYLIEKQFLQIEKKGRNSIYSIKTMENLF